MSPSIAPPNAKPCNVFIDSQLSLFHCSSVHVARVKTPLAAPAVFMSPLTVSVNHITPAQYTCVLTDAL